MLKQSRLTKKTPSKKNTKSEYYSGKVIVECPEEIDEVLENSIPQLQVPKSKKPNSRLISAPVQNAEQIIATPDVIKLMLEKIDKRLNEMDGKIAVASTIPSNVETRDDSLEDEEMEEQQQPLNEDEVEALNWMEH